MSNELFQCCFISCREANDAAQLARKCSIMALVAVSQRMLRIFGPAPNVPYPVPRHPKKTSTQTMKEFVTEALLEFL